MSSSPASSSHHRDPDASLVAERVYRVVGLVEFDENDGTTFLWSNTSAVESLIRNPVAASPTGASGVPSDAPRFEVADVRPLPASSVPADMDNAVKKVAQWFVQCDVNESQDPHEQQVAAAAAAAAVSSEMDSATASTSYPQTPGTCWTPASLLPPSQHSQQQQQHQQGMMLGEPPVPDLHWLHFSDVVAHASVDPASNRRPQAHFVRACACRFEVPDCFARGFSRLFLVVSATLVRCSSSSSDWAQDLLSAACNAVHTLDCYDQIGEYVARARRCFEVRFVSFLPRCIETVDWHLERAKKAKQEKESAAAEMMERKHSEAEAMMEEGQEASSNSSNLMGDKNGTACPNDATSSSSSAPNSPLSPTTAPVAAYTGPSLVKLEDMRHLFTLAPAINAQSEGFKIEEEIHLRSVLMKQQQQSQQAAASPLSPSLSTPEDMIMHWCLKRGTKGNLAPFEQVVNIYTGGASNNNNNNKDAMTSPAALAKLSVLDVCSLQSAAHMVTALREIFGEADAPASSSSNGSVSASLYTTVGGSTMQQDFLVDPALSQDPAAWPGLLWNATDYLKVLRRDGQVASDNNSMCISSTHFFG